MSQQQRETDESSGIWVLIPAFNVADHLAELLQQVKMHLPQDRILVIDDGSSDHTAKLAESAHVSLLRHETNQGKGLALRTGFDYLIKRGASWIVTLDGDLQHDPEKITEFINLAQSGKFDLIIGARPRNSEMPWDRRFSNWSTSTFLSILTGRRIRDAQSGYRMIRGELLKDVNLTGRYYDLEAECLLKWIKRGARLGWVEIPTRYRGSLSSIHRGKDTIRFLRMVFRNL